MFKRQKKQISLIIVEPTYKLEGGLSGRLGVPLDGEAVMSGRGVGVVGDSATGLTLS